MNKVDKIFKSREKELQQSLQDLFDKQEIPVKYIKPDISDDLVLALCESLLKYTSNPDVVWHAAHAAMKATGASKQEIRVLIKSLTS